MEYSMRRQPLLACVMGFAGPVGRDGPGRGEALPGQLQSVADTYLKTPRRGRKDLRRGVACGRGGRQPVDVYAGTNGHRDARPIDRRTLFQIGSNTKHFTAALVLKLEAEGKLNIDQTVGRLAAAVHRLGRCDDPRHC